MSNVQGNIFDIQRFCVHDGPGIRTTVFVKGCPLRCLWCHNPESQKSAVNIAFYAHKCLYCGACADACKQGRHRFDLTRNTENGSPVHVYDRDGCLACGECAAACPASAIEKIGRRVSADEVMDEVLRDKAFYKNSGGGLTVSGGEPLAQPDFTAALLEKAKAEGIHTCVETCGYCPGEVIKRIAPLVDLFLFDIKETDDALHKEFTGVPFTPIRENLLLIDAMGAGTVLRCPIVPGKNLRDEHLRAIGTLARELKGVKDVEVMAYHTLGNGKYDALEMENAMAGAEAMDSDEKKRCLEIINAARSSI